VYIKTALQQTGCTGKDLIGRSCRNNDQIDVTVSDTCSFNGTTRSLLGKIEGELTLGCDVPLRDTGTFTYPFVAGINH